MRKAMDKYEGQTAQSQKHKLFKISACIQCPMMEHSIIADYKHTWRCRHPESKYGTRKVHPNSGTSPDWCPLRECPTTLIFKERPGG